MSQLNFTNHSVMNMTTILSELSDPSIGFDFWFFFLIALTIILITVTLAYNIKIATVISSLMMIFVSYVFSILGLIQPEQVIIFIVIFISSLFLALVT